MAADARGMAATKLRPPALPARLVQRPRLDAMLGTGIDARVPLLLISAPAGSGKSTLLASWVASRSEAVAWLQVESNDSDPARFWSSLVGAIGRCRPDLAAKVMPLVVGSQGEEAVVVPAIVNVIVDEETPVVLVIDDYHLIDDADVHRGVERMIDLCPEQLTIVIATRVDPPFRLGRMRVRSRITEVRASNLRFAADEAPALLGAGGSSLAPQGIEDLCTRTEGWAAGLVLAGLSLEQASDKDHFIETFRGDDQLVVSYLSDELLATMAPDDRRRLLETAGLDHLSGPLIDAVTGSEDGNDWLTDIARRNQLVIRLDNTGEWFRYHHLFRDLLLLEARRSMPERLPELNRRAAVWFESRGDHAHAVAHRLAAGDVSAAMASMRFVGPDLLGNGQVRTLRSMLEQIGPVAATDAVGSLLWGWCEYLAGRYPAAQHWLDLAVDLGQGTFDPMVANPLRINLALGSGDVATALDAARLVSPIEDLWTRPAELAAAVGAAYTWAGRAPEAAAALHIAVARATDERRFTAHVMALVSIAVNEMEHGTHPAAHAAAVAAVTTAQSFGLAAYHGVAPAFAIRGRTSVEPTDAVADAHHALALGRRATTALGLAYVVTTCADTFLEHHDDAGVPLVAEARGLIARCVDPGIAGRYLARVESRHRMAALPPANPAAVEQLTDRELAVLRYLPTKLSQRDISSELYVSLNTVKTHCAAIFRKLGVGDRQSAVQAARDLHLL
jgi:LuxR family maltose regulon positive regulatory protein